MDCAQKDVMDAIKVGLKVAHTRAENAHHLDISKLCGKGVGDNV